VSPGDQKSHDAPDLPPLLSLTHAGIAESDDPLNAGQDGEAVRGRNECIGRPRRHNRLGVNRRRQGEQPAQQEPKEVSRDHSTLRFHSRRLAQQCAWSRRRRTASPAEWNSNLIRLAIHTWYTFRCIAWRQGLQTHVGSAGSAAITFQYNTIGPSAPGIPGEGIKDRSARTVIRYNKFLTVTGHPIWILQTQGGQGMIDQQPGYHTTHIYGNVIYNGPGGNGGMVRYSAGAEDISVARRGPHYFYHNTLINHANQAGPNGRWWSVAILTPQQSEIAGLGWTTIVDCRNNIIANLPETPGAQPGDFSLLGSNAGELRLGKNWISAGFNPYRVPWNTTGFYGLITGLGQTIVGASPGFANLAALDFHLADASPAIDLGGPLAPELPAAYAVTEEIVDPQASQPRNVVGTATDLGAFEGPGVSLPQVPGTIQFGAASFTVDEGAGTAAVTVTRSGGAWGDVTVKYAVTVGTATAPSDFFKSYGTLSWSHGQEGPQSFPVTIVNDAVAENNETVTLVLGYPTGGVFDGRFIYFVPIYDGTATHGRVLRLDTQSDFSQAASWRAYDAGNSGIPNTKGFKGGVFDGRYVYFIPYVGSGRVLRFDTQGEFANSASWSAFDAAFNVGGAAGFMGGAFDGRYVWFTPYNNNGPSGRVLRYDTQGTFANAASWQAYDAGNTGGLGAKGFQGALFDGRYVYFVPYRNINFSGVVLRFDARQPQQLPDTISGGSFF